MPAFTVRLDDDKARKLDQLANKLDRPRSYLAAQAIDDYLAREEWQIAEIEADLPRPTVGTSSSRISLVSSPNMSSLVATHDPDSSLDASGADEARPGRAPTLRRKILRLLPV